MEKSFGASCMYTDTDRTMIELRVKGMIRGFDMGVIWVCDNDLCT